MDPKLKFPLKVLLCHALVGDYTRIELLEIFRLCQAIARQHIRRKILAGKLHHTGLSEADITLDCIAELFRRDEHNVLVEFAKYFNYQHIHINDELDDMLLVHVRRLTFTVVNDNLFRIYHEADPSLGKILRNIKIAVDKSANLKMEEHFDEHYVVVTETDQLRHCASISDRELTSRLIRSIRWGDTMPQILEKLAEMLCSQDIYQRKVGLMPLALAVKDIFKNFDRSTADETTVVEAQLLAEDIQKIIRKTCDALSAEMEPHYVTRGKLDRKTFDRYLAAVNRMLSAEFLETRNDQKTYYEFLREYIPDLTNTEYREHHRTVFEYLAKLSKRRTIKGLRKM